MNWWLVLDVAVGLDATSGVTHPVTVMVSPDCCVIVGAEDVVAGCGVCAETTAVIARMPQHSPGRFFIMGYHSMYSAVRGGHPNGRPASEGAGFAPHCQRRRSR